MKKIFFWSPHNSKIGTINSVLNSIKCIKKFYKESYVPYLINSTYEWEDQTNINLINIRKNKTDFRNSGNKGYLMSRIFFIKIFFACFFPLKKLIKNDKPEYFIAHLITSLPLILFRIFSFKTKLILRISGEPNLNIFRILLWKLTSRNIHLVTCPSEETKEILIKKKIFDINKIKILYDPIIDMKQVYKKRLNNENFYPTGKYFLSVGRLTVQKNFGFLIESFKKISHKYPEYRLIILGEGEEEKKLKKLISRLKLDDKVFLKGFKENPFFYMKNAKCFILPSIYENPGHVIIEAAINNCPIISSNCPTGPGEFLKYGKGGYLFKTNDKNDLLEKINNFMTETENEIYKKKLFAKKQSKNYTIYGHKKLLIDIIK